MPALAVAEELVREGAEVAFAGTPDRAEAHIVPAAGYAFDPFRVQGLPRSLSPRLLPRPGPARVAFSAARARSRQGCRGPGGLCADPAPPPPPGGARRRRVRRGP